MRFDSAHRPQGRIVNEYIFKEQKFTIDCNLQFVLNRPMALKLNPDFNEPNVVVNLIFGGFFKDRAPSSTMDS